MEPEYLFINPSDGSYVPNGWGWDGPGWYFWDETQAYCHGPYESAKLAKEGLVKYCHEVLGS